MTGASGDLTITAKIIKYKKGTLNKEGIETYVSMVIHYQLIGNAEFKKQA